MSTSSGLATRGRILVVDDDLALAEMLGIVLRGEGFDPVFCADGAEAVQVFRDSQPDLILLDLMLPGLGGIDICRAIRLESGVPIVMLTAKSDTVDVEHGDRLLVAHSDAVALRDSAGETALGMAGASAAGRAVVRVGARSGRRYCGSAPP